MEKFGRFSGWVWRDWGNTAWADMAGLGSLGLQSNTTGFRSAVRMGLDIL